MAPDLGHTRQLAEDRDGVGIEIVERLGRWDRGGCKYNGGEHEHEGPFYSRAPSHLPAYARS